MHNTFVNLFALAMSLFFAVELSVASIATDADSPAAVSIQVYPKAIQLNSPRDQQSLVVTATYADGSTKDVTSECTVEAASKPLGSILVGNGHPGTQRIRRADRPIRRPPTSRSHQGIGHRIATQD